MPASRISIAVSLIVGAFLLVHIVHGLYLSGLQDFWEVDDAYITFRYVDHWLEGVGLVFNQGERVEGYSNFLWLLLLTPFRVLGFELAPTARALGLLFGSLNLLLAFALCRAFRLSTWVSLSAVWLLTVDGAFARWSIDGLETQLFAFLTSLACLLEVRRQQAFNKDSRGASGSSFVIGLVLGLDALTRPEGLLALGLFSAYRLLLALKLECKARGNRSLPSEPGQQLLSKVFLKDLLFLWAGAACFALPHMVFRLIYYGDYVPNTAHAKLEPGLVSVVRGLKYVYDFLLQRIGIGVGLVIVYVERRRRGNAPPPMPTFPATFCALMVVYIVTIGGDWMGEGRYFMHFGPLLALVVASRLSLDSSAREKSNPSRLLLVVVALMGVFSFYGSSWRGERVWFSYIRLNHLERKMVIDYLTSHAPPSSTLLSEEIGQVPYYTKLRTFDFFGLTDRHVALYGHYDPDSNTGSQKYDLDYSLSLEPDYLLMTVFKDAFDRYNAQPVESARFPRLRDYEYVPLPMPQVRLELYQKKSLRKERQEAGEGPSPP